MMEIGCVDSLLFIESRWVILRKIKEQLTVAFTFPSSKLSAESQGSGYVAVAVIVKWCDAALECVRQHASSSLLSAVQMRAHVSQWLLALCSFLSINFTHEDIHLYPFRVESIQDVCMHVLRCCCLLHSEAWLRDGLGVESIDVHSLPHLNACVISVPGSVGAAPVQNIGAYGVEVKDYIHSIEVYDIENDLFQNIKNQDNVFDFGYRDSIFKKFKNKYLIISITFKLKRERDLTTKYQGLEIEDADDVKSIREKVINIRKSKLPNTRDTPNCGSFFKNPIVSKVELDNILNINKDIKYFTNGDECKLSTASLIESLVLKGYAVGGASISLNHALIIVNKERLATYEDVANLSEYIVKQVFDKYKVSLEREVNMI